MFQELLTACSTTEPSCYNVRELCLNFIKYFLLCEEEVISDSRFEQLPQPGLIPDEVVTLPIVTSVHLIMAILTNVL